jgi:hypothetical protein
MSSELVYTACLHFPESKSFILYDEGGGGGKELLLRIIAASGNLRDACDDVNTNLVLHDSETVATLPCFVRVHSLHKRKAASLIVLNSLP